MNMSKFSMLYADNLYEDSIINNKITRLYTTNKHMPLIPQVCPGVFCLFFVFHVDAHDVNYEKIKFINISTRLTTFKNFLDINVYEK